MCAVRGFLTHLRRDSGAATILGVPQAAQMLVARPLRRGVQVCVCEWVQARPEADKGRVCVCAHTTDALRAFAPCERTSEGPKLRRVSRRLFEKWGNGFVQVCHLVPASADVRKDGMQILQPPTCMRRMAGADARAGRCARTQHGRDRFT